MSLRPGVTLEKMNTRGAGRLPGLFGFRVMAVEEGLLVAEIDVDKDPVGTKLPGQLKRLRARGGDTHDGDSVLLQRAACGVQEMTAVIDDQDAQRSCARSGCHLRQHRGTAPVAH